MGGGEGVLGVGTRRETLTFNVLLMRRELYCCGITALTRECYAVAVGGGWSSSELLLVDDGLTSKRVNDISDSRFSMFSAGRVIIIRDCDSGHTSLGSAICCHFSRIIGKYQPLN